MHRPRPSRRSLLPVLALVGTLAGSTGVVRAQPAEVLCGTLACVAASSFCLAPSIAAPLSPFGTLGLLFDSRHGGMRLSAGLLQHAPLGFVIDADVLIGASSSTVAQGSVLGRWTLFREGFGAKWALGWEPTAVPVEGGLQGVVRFGATGRVGDRGPTPRVLGHVGVALEWIALPPMGLAFTAGALVPLGAGMLSSSEAPIPYFSLDLMLLLGDASSVTGDFCSLDAAPPPPRVGNGRQPSGPARPPPARAPSATSGSCGGDDCFGPGCGDCGSCGGPPAPPPSRKAVIAPK